MCYINKDNNNNAALNLFSHIGNIKQEKIHNFIADNFMHKKMHSIGETFSIKIYLIEAVAISAAINRIEGNKRINTTELRMEMKYPEMGSQSLLGRSYELDNNHRASK